MTIDITTKNITLDEALKVFVDEKMSALEKLVGTGPSSVRVEIGMPSKHHRSGPVFRAEANLKMGSMLFRAEATDYDLRTAITKVKNELQIQIKKSKEKSIDSSRKPRP